METKIYQIKGTYAADGQEHQFEKEIEAHSENFAKEKTLSLMGSKHKLKRNAVKIGEVKEKK
ncbi:MAG: 50S ribosomal protein L18a [Candidatus Diapherotrites archaeon]|uniref:Large ribosomal subunit protein eL20 n=1 Tax=Candidatus Iainarchaeum sp. TaxID=3101447 RepID=A0A8T3YQL9_9ARCH|nr:50S ribosomal protein L18a [Candidatus Diapherotrites archaeon]